MKSSLLQTRSPIGVDVGRYSIKAVQLRGSGAGSQLHARMVLPRSTSAAHTPGTALDAAEISRLILSMERAGFDGNAVVLAVPDDQLLSSMLDLPPRMPGVPLENIARMEFARVHKCEPASLELSCWDLPEADRASKGTSVMAVGYSHAASEPYLDALESAGLDVVGMDTTASALARACGPVISGSDTAAVLDIGAGDARLVLVQAGNVTYERTVADGGLAPLAKSLGERLELDRDQVQYVLEDAGLGEPGERRGAEALSTVRQSIVSHLSPLLSDLQMTFAYAEQRYPGAPVTNVLLTGGGALIPGLAAHVSQVLGLEVRWLSCADIIKCAGPADDHTTPLLLKAIGLAQFPDI
jgi:type IV pilus assembly protein PilM